MHEEVLNFMLANTCHNTNLSTDAPGVSEFTFDMHCVEVVVTAKRIRDNEGPLKYEVLGFSWKEI